MDPHRTLAGAAIASAALLLATPLLPVAGLTPQLSPLSDESQAFEDAAPSSTPEWSEDRWWTFQVSVQGNDPVLAAIIVHEAGPMGIHVGMNRSGAILGLPFSGNFTNDLSPEFAGETWKMYDFPLEDGENWDQELLGHTLHTEVEATELETVDGDSTTDGYALEATAYGQTVASYTYHPDAGWFDELMIRDPGSGEVLLDASLVAHGASWDEAYYVNEKIHETTIEYPGTLPGEETFTVPDTYERARVVLSAVAEAGAVDAELQDADANTVATARALVNDRDVTTAATESPAGTWTLRQTGAGDARLHLEILGVRVVDPAHRSNGTDATAPRVSELSPEESLPAAEIGGSAG